MKVIDMYLNKGLTGKPIGKVKGIVIHWFASPNSKASNVIKYWERQANGVNAHDVICLDGALYRAVPYNMMAYQVGCPRGYTKEAVRRLGSYPNQSVVGIECAHVDMTGKMTDATYKTLVEQSANLLTKFGLTVNDLWLHSEIVGKDYKDCHRWFTTTKPSDWIKFKNEVNALLNPKSSSPKTPIIKKIVDAVKTVIPVAKPKIAKLSYVRVLKENTSGSDVKALQNSLNKLGFNCGVADGAFGQKTKSAVILLQQKYKLSVDGLVGQNTIAKINSLIK